MINDPAPSFSVVIPTYNRWPHVAEAIESVLRQSHPDVECIVVDDGSTDETPERVASAYPAVRLVRQENRERGAARNAGVAAATGTYVTFLDSDDVFDEEHLAGVSAAAAGGATVIATGGSMWNPDTGARWPLAPSSPNAALNLEEIIWNNPVPSSCMTVRKELFVAIGGFCEDRRVAGREDWLFLCRVATQHPITRLPQATALLRHHPGRSMAQPDVMIPSRLAALGYLLEDRGDGSPLTGHLRDLAIAGTYRFTAANHYRAGRMREARDDLSRVRGHLGLTRLVTTSGRLWIQTFLGSRGSRALRMLRDRVRSRS